MRSPAYELTRCPVCRSASAAEIAGQEEMRQEVEALWAFHTRRLRPDTPPEHLADRVAFSQRAPIRLVRCRRCGLVYRNPRERAAELEGTYANERMDDTVLRSLLETQAASYRTQAARLTRAFGRTGSGLEVGSYVGAFLTAARDAGWHFDGLDINEGTNAFARALGFHITDGDLDSFEPDRRYDVVAIWNCFDQLPEPSRAVRRARALLDTGGMLALRVPNGAFYARLRGALDGPLAGAARELLAQNNLLAFPYRHGFTTQSLELLLGDAGFTVQEMVGDTLVPIADEWTKRWAALEERAVKGALGALGLAGGQGAAASPWMELYARAE